jgi:peptidoglycan/xylan/chitin deacetylase (PgdA/CDA1 family)
MAAGEPLPARAVAITFDDGYRDNLELAAPELERRGMDATFFLVPRLLERRLDPWWERAAWAVDRATASAVTVGDRRLPLETPADRKTARGVISEMLKRRDRARREAALAEIVERLGPPPGDDLAELFLDWEGARELASRGFEIGSHSRDHCILSEETPDDQRDDLAESRAMLEEHLGVSISTVAYPNGTRRDYDAATLAAARSAGYAHGVTTRKGWNSSRTPPLELRRAVVYPERGSRFLRTALEIAGKRAHQVGSKVRAKAGGYGVTPRQGYDSTR